MNIFNTIQMTAPKHSTFDLSYDLKLSLKMGPLVPVHIQETIPGDVYHMAQEAMFRMMPMIAPIMHKVDATFHTFFVPNRILWKNWEKFITGGQYGDVSPAFPTIKLTEVTPSSLANYLGLPVKTAASMPAQDINALPFAAYQNICREFYRDQNLSAVDPLELQDGDNTVALGTELELLNNRCWEHDYFTSALPWAQKGTPVELPIDFTGADILARDPSQTPDGFNPLWRSSTNTAPFNVGDPLTGTINVTRANSNAFGSTTIDGTAQYPSYYDPEGSLYLQGTAGTTINDLRSAYALQRWLEKNARGGTRYVESLLVHFGVRSSDARLQRPEYLGGSKTSMAISEVLQTSSTDATTPQGNMSGHGVSVTGGRSYSYRCEEHGYIITLVSILPKTAYYHGLPRHFSKNDRFDFPWPDFAFLGEQEILNQEIAWLLDPDENAGTFGYIPRYSEYRYNPSRVAGQMATTLEFWHMGRKFDNAAAFPPALNGGFVSADPTTRIFAVEDPEEDSIVGHVFHKIIAKRALPKYGTPGGL